LPAGGHWGRRCADEAGKARRARPGLPNDWQSA
jgi:hypothetical protein